MEVRPVDPRDTEIEVDSPIYRVFFWERQSDQPYSGFKSDEYEIAEARDVHEMTQWAEANAGDRTFTVYVVVDKTLVRLSGRDPTAEQGVLDARCDP
ncbi:MAG TPA: hypothetical protein VNC78_02020 [Actinomycetota bacterium]|nr:hypothetical protein [Actinomycetota bacterium]